MSKYVEVRGVKIGEGVPKICVPIVGKTKEEILAAARSFEDVALDVVEDVYKRQDRDFQPMRLPE